MTTPHVQFGQQLLEQLEEHAWQVDPDPQRDRLRLIDSATFMDTNYEQEWLIQQILVRGQPAIIGGPKKALKTNILIDLAISLATRRPFLNHFGVPRQVRVGMFSGESGPAVIQETVGRICRAKSIRSEVPSGCHWGFEPPQLSRLDDLDAIGEEITDNELEVVIIDPLYLSLLAGTKDVQASNLYQIGPLLAQVTRVCLDAGATPIFAHHTKKAGHSDNPTELEDLAFAGVQEFARQWILLGRREKYEPGTGQHRLWLNVGGSAGQSGCWALDIHEGRLQDDFGGRRWDVQVTSATEERSAARQRRQQVVEEERRERDAALRARVLAALQQRPGGATRTEIRNVARVPFPKILAASTA